MDSFKNKWANWLVNCHCRQIRCAKTWKQTSFLSTRRVFHQTCCYLTFRSHGRLFFNQNLKNESNKLNKPQLEESGTMLRCIICTSRQNDDKIMEPFNKKKNEAGRVRVCGPTTGRYWLSSITKWIFSCYDGGGFLSGRCRNRGNGARREHRRPISCKKMKVTSRVFPPLRSSLGHSKPVSLVRLESTISAVLGFSFSFF